jgi:HD-GYP domain-containing protein (c-di-GMP phosphodiesterase class II)
MTEESVLASTKLRSKKEAIPPGKKITPTQELQRSMVELTLAYDATIEGFARALDLREREGEGHCLRVTELAVQLAKAIEMDKTAISHLSRGAFLHDIGKMGIPDSVLQKTGPLTDEEKAIIRKHPQYAYDLLLPIAYLYPALDIPYCHHEKWDGTGYPQGLKGRKIPLAARIFSVVDAWDSMMTIRPYRPAWPRRDILEYIQEEKGSSFDPGVVDAFLKIVSAED